MSYSEPPPPPPQYGEPMPPESGGMPPRRSGMAIAGLVVGILGVIPCFWNCLVLSILGIVFGLLGRRDIRESGGTKTGEGMARAAVILGVIGAVGGIVYWILVAAGVIDITAVDKRS